jgi:ABC-2 type transport system permease protein
VLRLELRKLRALRRTYLGLAGSAIIPVVLLIALETGDGGPPDEVPFARSVQGVGLAIPLFSLAFATFFLLPLLASLVAGDAISGETSGGTLKTILTRSVTRPQIFRAKLYTAAIYTLALVAVQFVVGTIAGVAVLGTDPLPTLSGTEVGLLPAIPLVAAAFLFAAVTVFALACFSLLLSSATLNTVAAIGGTVILIVVLQVAGTFESLDFLRPYLVTQQANAWFGIIRDPIDWWPLMRAVIVSACWAIPCVGVAYTIFTRRDVLS